jgi:hypothetical protein
MSTPDCDCGAELGGFHAFHCARYATIDDNWRLETNQAQFVSNDGHDADCPSRDGFYPENCEYSRSRLDGHSCGAVDDALPRLKVLLADTKAMVVQAEALVASMREPANYFRKY